MSLGSVSLAGAAPAAPTDVASCFSPTPHSFTDVTSDDYYDTAVSWLVESGITSGVAPGKYGPNVTVTRAQMAQFLWNAADSPAPAAPHSFTDVTSDDYYDAAVSWLVESGITSGVAPGKYGPNVTVTRGQMAQFLWNAADSPAPAAPHSFTDVTSDDYYDAAVSWLVESGITSGIEPGIFAPAADVTRGQMAQFLWRDACGPQPTDFGSAAYGSMYIGVVVPGDETADPPTEDETIPVNIPLTGLAWGGWAQEAHGPFNVNLALNSGSFPLEVPGIGTVTVSYSLPEDATGAGQFDPETGIGGFDLDMIISVTEVDIGGNALPTAPCDLAFGMSLEGAIDANTGMLSARQDGFELTPPGGTDCGGLGAAFGDLLGGPDNSVNLNFVVSKFAPPTKFDSAATGNINIDVVDGEDVTPLTIPVTGQAKGVWSHEGAGTGAFGVNLATDGGSFPLEVFGLPVTVTYSVGSANGTGSFAPQTGAGGFDIDLVVTIEETSFLGPMEQPCDLTFGMSLDGQIDAGTGTLNANQDGFDVTPPATDDCGGLGGTIGPLLSGPSNSVDLEFEVGQF